ncbi:hypothetical protein RhiirA5_386234 [Rhizophagus irregularis]|uniref:DUF659 domain-containing protein n=1 Tax=Rhizophagus irregularis TaxID=588596 RepID=A0A2N0NKI7_9GLOM|nr:hypothetical protein RhiirA5_386234 [Rhizophagus irregularis]
MDTLTPISPIEVIEPVNTPVNQQAQQSEKEKCLELNAGYNPPTREYLSEHLFETELFIINDKIEDDIMNQQNLTLKFLAAKIEDVIEKIGPNRISAIVSDNAANVKKARAIISEKYPRIENVQCISHCINLVTYNIIYHIFADQLLHKVNILGFFSQLSYGRITKALAEPDDADEDDSKNDNENTLTNDNDTIGKGILDYNINDLFDEYVNE